METVRSSREIERMFAKGRRGSDRLLMVLALENPEGRGPGGRVAFIAGKKLGTAVTRNRSKRVLREAVRRLGGPWAGWDVALVARPSLANARTHEIDAAVRSVLKRVGVVA